MHLTSRALAVLAVVALLLPSPAVGQRAIDLPARDRAVDIASETVYAVGRAEGASWEMFAGVSGLAFDDDGHLFVLDRGGHRVIVFDADGGFVREFGRQGGGPGEFQLPLALALTAEGRVVVSDLARRSFTVFSPDGEYLSSHPFPDESGMPLPELRSRPAGGVLWTARALPMGGPVRVERAGTPGRAPDSGAPGRAGATGQERDGQPRETQPILLHPLEAGASAVELYAAAVPQPRVETTGGRGETTVRVGMPPVFSPTVHWGVLPDGGLAVAHDTEYAIRLTDAEGEVRAVVRRPIRPRAVTERDRRDAREQRRAQLEEGSGVERVVVRRLTVRKP